MTYNVLSETLNHTQPSTFKNTFNVEHLWKPVECFILCRDYALDFFLRFVVWNGIMLMIAKLFLL